MRSARCGGARRLILQNHLGDEVDPDEFVVNQGTLDPELVVNQGSLSLQVIGAPTAKMRAGRAVFYMAIQPTFEVDPDTSHKVHPGPLSMCRMVAAGNMIVHLV